VAAYVRAQIDAGEVPRVDLLRDALQRLSRSPSRRHAEYARRELQLLDRVEAAA
jgi:hypothetical protein